MSDEMIMYRSGDGVWKIDVRMAGETLWLTQAQIAQLYGRDRSVITKHLRNIFDDNELDVKSNVQFLHIVNSDNPIAYYTIDVIIEVGYRNKFIQGLKNGGA